MTRRTTTTGVTAATIANPPAAPAPLAPTPASIVPADQDPDAVIEAILAEMQSEAERHAFQFVPTKISLPSGNVETFSLSDGDMLAPGREPTGRAQLEQRIAEAEALQARMKATNLAIRQNAKAGRTAQLAALGALNQTEAAAAKLLTPDFLNRIGYPNYALTNNSANIRRLKQQLAKAQVLAAATTTEEVINGVTVTDNVEADRVQIHFPIKPSPAFCDRLNHNGFHWAPSLQCWQRYRSPYALTLAKQFASQYA